MDSLIGQRFGAFVVQSFEGTVKGQRHWLCKCDCGGTVVMMTKSLKRAKGCSGCWPERARVKATKHGDWVGGKAQRLYTIWQAMKARCTYEKHPRFSYYGGRGITICPAWMVWGNFKEWALFNGYGEDLTIDRIDSDKGYEPDNCRFISKSENSRKAIQKSHETRRLKCAA